MIRRTCNNLLAVTNEGHDPEQQQRKTIFWGAFETINHQKTGAVEEHRGK
jgi:hypothetical protein